MKKLLNKLVCGGVFVLLLAVAALAQAEEPPAEAGEKFVDKVKRVVQAIDVYRSPVAPQLSDTDREKSCRDLEYELASLQPMTYSYKPDFYDDPVQGTAFWVGTTLFFPAYAALGYTSYYGYQENERIYKTQDRIEALRRLKAEMRCFEG
jgi:hypothetical protein